MSIRDNAEHCVFCGKTIPEGTQVCIICGRGKPREERCAENAESHCKSYPYCYGCNSFRKPTNYDRIRNMSVEEWVKVITTVEICDQLCAYGKNGQCNGYVSDAKKCEEGIKQWLESEVEGE